MWGIKPSGSCDDTWYEIRKSCKIGLKYIQIMANILPWIFILLAVIYSMLNAKILQSGHSANFRTASQTSSSLYYSYIVRYRGGMEKNVFDPPPFRPTNFGKRIIFLTELICPWGKNKPTDRFFINRGNFFYDFLNTFAWNFQKLNKKFPPFYFLPKIGETRLGRLTLYIFSKINYLPFFRQMESSSSNSDSFTVNSSIAFCSQPRWSLSQWCGWTLES